MSSAYLQITTARAGLLAKLLEAVPVRQRDAIYNDMSRDLNKINDILNNINKKNEASKKLRSKQKIK